VLVGRVGPHGEELGRRARCRAPVALVGLVALVALVVVPGSTAGAEGLGERVLSFTSDAEVEADGSLLVHETIVYQFPEPRHGIIRSLVTRQRFDSSHERVYPLDVVSVSSPDGAPVEYVVSTNGAVQEIRIGDPSIEIDGQHTYDLTYRLEGLLNSQPDSVELFWNATGNLSDVPTDRAQVTVHGPTGITNADCFQGAKGSRERCGRNDVAGDRALFEADELGPHEGLTVVVALPQDAVSPPPAPILEETRTLAWGFQGSPSRWGATALALAAAGIGLGLLAYRKGRDQRAVGSAIDVAFADERSPSRRRPLFEHKVGPVQFEPPDHVPPGLFGTLVDERADVRDVSATIVDLAVRGYLRIEEIGPTTGRRRDQDYRLVSLRPADERLRRYESILVSHLFADGGTVELSDLLMHFHPQMAEVRDAMYKEVVDQGWYRAPPDRTRRAWTAIGVMALIAAVAVTALLAVTVGWGLVGLALVAGALALIIGARWMPARTAKGSGVLTRALGFAVFIRESEAHRAQFAEKVNLFTEYLPYAVALGCTERWARAFAGLAVPPPTWYVGSQPFAFEPVAFGSAVAGFSSRAGTTLVATPGGSGGSGFSGGGFSGGGGGGGGVSSW
jgi:uncharacterized membrane protein YgcG